MNLRMSKMVSAALVVAVILQAPAASAQDAKQYELKDDERVVVKRADDKKLPARFNYDRPFLISINRAIPGAADIKTKLADEIARARVLDKVLFETFGSEPPASVTVKIGKRVPVEIAQAVIRVLAGVDNLAVTVYVYNDDSITQGNTRLFFAYTQRVVIGSLGESKGKPLTKERAGALLKEGIGQKEFFKLLSESG